MTSRLDQGTAGGRISAVRSATTAVGNAPAGADMAGSDAADRSAGCGSGAHRAADRLRAYVTFKPGPGRFPLVARHHAAPLVVSSDDYPGVTRVVDDLSADIRSVTGVRPTVAVDKVPAQREVVIIGTLGHSPIVDKLVSTGKVDVTGVAGKWDDLAPAGGPAPDARSRPCSGHRGQRPARHHYGVPDDVSRGIGVSPWSYWTTSSRPTGTTSTSCGAAQPGDAGREVPRLLHQRRDPSSDGRRPGHSDPARHRGTRTASTGVLLTGVRDHAPAQGRSYLWPAVCDGPLPRTTHRMMRPRRGTAWSSVRRTRRR